MSARTWIAAAFCLALAAPAAANDGRPDLGKLPVSANSTPEQLAHGEKVFHGEAANGKCFNCHGHDAKGTTLGNDLTNGALGWGESFSQIKATIRHNMEMSPGQDGDLTPADVDAVVAYVWALVHQERMERQQAGK